jgi:phage terminase Nu1 subunit (DNA packaging protein)
MKKPKQRKSRTTGRSKVSQAQFAQLRKVDPSTVTLWKRQGYLVVDKHGLIDVAQSNAKLKARPSTYRGGKTATVIPDEDANGLADEALQRLRDAHAPLSLAEAQRVKENYLAKLRQLEFDKLTGQVVHIDDVVKEVAAVFSTVKNVLRGLPSKLAPRVLACADAQEAEEIMRADIDQALTELSSESDDDVAEEDDEGDLV